VTRARRAGFALAALALALAIVEALSWIALAAVEDTRVPAPAAAALPAAERADSAPAQPAPAPLPEDRATDSADAQRAERRRYWTLHPYVGYVAAAGMPVEFGDEVPGLAVNAYGFIDTQEPLRQRSPDRLIVAVVGGSVAERFGHQGVAAFERALARDPRYADRRVEWVRLGLSGHKQPQQLMTIAYLLAEGAEFDVVLAIDGFNEIALPRVDLVTHGVAAVFPRYWKQQTANLPDAPTLRAIGEIELLESQLAELEAEPTGWLRFSGLARLVRRVRAQRLDDDVARRHAALAERLRARADAPRFGPYREYASRTELAEHVAGVWARSSRALAALAREHGVRYVHVLQPNPHVPNSKPLSPEERELVGDATMLYREDARDFHPLLRATGAELARHGIEFLDATEVFAGHEETLYVDSCCHFGARGNEILAEWIAARMAERDAAAP